MEPEQLQQVPVAPYPAPPPFWRHFTIENAKHLKDAELDAQLPLDLNYLRPPPPPAQDAASYTTFSMPIALDPTPALPPPEILLFDPSAPSFNHARALKQLTTSLLLNFLELSTVLSNDPVRYEEKLQDIERLMLNVHFVINLYRPHQAREGVKEMLQDQLEDGKQEIKKCDDMKKKIEIFLKEVDQKGQTQKAGGKAEAKETESLEDARKLWDLIHDMKGD